MTVRPDTDNDTSVSFWVVDRAGPRDSDPSSGPGDAMNGDQTSPTDTEGIERAWEVSDPELAAPPRVELYRVGSWGQRSITDLTAPRPLARALPLID